MAFSDHAHKKMMELFRNHSHEVGSQIASGYPGKTPTDCITYVINVLKHAFTKVGNPTVATMVGSLGTYGTQLASYLVKTHKWKAVYYNPDVNHPRDGQLEHPFSYYKSVLPSKSYYEIPIAHMAVNYAPTPKTHGQYKSFSGIGGSKSETPEDMGNLRDLEKIKFGVGVSRGGRHTWLFSAGKVYEVHWDQIGATLYEATELTAFAWLSGAIVIPPDAYAGAKFDQVGWWEAFSEWFR